MKETYMPCIDCCYALNARHPDHEHFWQKLIEGTSYDEPYRNVFRNDGSELESIFCDLEKMGFIITHELQPKWHVVKILGFREGSQLICVHRHIT